MPNLPLAAFDTPLRADQYLYVETHAWWLTTLGPYQHLAEHRIRRWVPADAGRPWLLDRTVTGRRTWLTGSDAHAAADGYDLSPTVPSGRFRAAHGAFDESDDLTDLDAVAGTDSEPVARIPACRAPERPRGTWRAPTPDFLALLPRDEDALLHRLRDDNPGSWFGPFAAALTALRTCLVPADLRLALARALCRLPGVRVVDEVENLDGQRCTALVHDAGRTLTELLFAADDGQFAGERDTLRLDSRCGLRAGTMISSTAVRTTVVDEEGALPR